MPSGQEPIADGSWAAQAECLTVRDPGLGRAVTTVSTSPRASRAEAEETFHEEQHAVAAEPSHPGEAAGTWQPLLERNSTPTDSIQKGIMSKKGRNKAEAEAHCRHWHTNEDLQDQAPQGIQIELHQEKSR